MLKRTRTKKDSGGKDKTNFFRTPTVEVERYPYVSSHRENCNQSISDDSDMPECPPHHKFHSKEKFQYNKGQVCQSKARLDKKVAIITGGNSGLGKETAIDFLQRGAKVILACRCMQKGEAAADDILKITKVAKDRLLVMKLDLASMKSIRQFAQDFQLRESRLDILVNNAGVMMVPYGTTDDGFETHFGVNYLGHFLLAHLLSDILVRSAPSRVITVSDILHRGWGSTMNFEKLMYDEEDYDRLAAYALSKIALVVFSRVFGEKLKGTGVNTYSLNPGASETEIRRHLPGIVRMALWPLMQEQWLGAQTQICCSVDENLRNETTFYYSNVAFAYPSSKAVINEYAEKLWAMTIQMVKLTPEEVHPRLKCSA